MADLCRGNQAENAYKLHNLVLPVMKELGVACDVVYSKINLIKNHDDYFQTWKESLLNKDYAHIDALNLNINTAVVGFELPESDTHYLTSKGISWINIAIHPLRFLSDLHFDVQSSFDYDFSKVAASLGEIAFCVSNLKLKHGSWVDHFSKSTLVIFGQSPFDKSVYFDNEFKKLDNYLREIDELSSRHEKVIYRPHPYISCAATDALIIDRYKAQLSSEIDVYRMFASGEISTACSISSSVITEAKEFGVAAVYLEPRARRFGFSINYSRLLNDCLFWKKFLKIEQDVSYLPISSSIPDNFLRETFAYWGYSTPHRSLTNKVDLLSKSFIQNEQQLYKTKSDVEQCKAKAQQAEARALQAEKSLNAMYNSTSWRITAPIRLVSNIKKNLSGLPKIVTFKIKKKVELLLDNSRLFINRRPKFRYIALAVLKPLLVLKKNLNKPYLNQSSEKVVDNDLENLSPRAHQLYVNIKSSIKRHKDN